MDMLSSILSTALVRERCEGRVAIALSGGLDSMVLLDVAATVAARMPAVRLEALHVHHGLSPNADAWAAWCERECGRRNVPLAIVRVAIDRDDTGGQGIEAAARAARYRAFAGCGAKFILAAQHADDQAETVLHQLLRGTGWAGLAGMGASRVLAPGVSLLRPFLQVDRAALEAHAREHRLEWVQDESNDDTAYTRNFLRHKVIPVIAERFPHYRASLARAARHAAEADALLEALARIDLQWDGQTAQADRLDTLPEARQTNALYHWLAWHRVSPPTQAQLAEWARQLFRAPPPDRLHQAGGHDFRIVRRGGRLHLEPAAGPPV